MTDLSSLSPSARRRAILIERIIYQYGINCFFCDEPTTPDDQTIEHILPKSRGGTNAISNVRLAHYSCNKLSGSAPLDVKYFIRSQLKKFGKGRLGWGYVRGLIKSKADVGSMLDEAAERQLKTWGLEI